MTSMPICARSRPSALSAPMWLQNGFKYFLEVFNPNVPHNMEREHLGEYINDCILRCLAA